MEPFTLPLVVQSYGFPSFWDRYFAGILQTGDVTVTLGLNKGAADWGC